MSRAIELVKECGMEYLIVKDGMDIDWTEELETFYQRAHREGQKAMRERAAKSIEPSAEHRKDASWGYLGGEEGVELLDNASSVIRELEIE